MPDMAPGPDTNLKIEMPREVFDKMARLIDTVCSQQGTIAGQQDLLSKMQMLVDKALTPPHPSQSRYNGWVRFRGR